MSQTELYIYFEVFELFLNSNYFFTTLSVSYVINIPQNDKLLQLFLFNLEITTSDQN